MSLSRQPLIILDGACGTTLQTMAVPARSWDGREGCNEYLNISAPDVVAEMHLDFLKAGAMAVETNTFGASSIVLSEYHLENRVREINFAAVAQAKKAIEKMAGSEPRYILGSVGPTTKLPALGHIEVAELSSSIREQVSTLVEAGVDALIIETCQDILQVKTALVAAFEVVDRAGVNLPVLCSVTFEKQGVMLVGSDIASVCATIAPFPVFSLGLNCATGPVDMRSHIHYLKQHWQGRISCIPNQGMPEVTAGRTVYPMTPEEFSHHMLGFVTRDGVSIVGGCCGTSPEHILHLSKTLKNTIPARVF